MADACHNLHNACKDICNLPEFKPVVYLFNLGRIQTDVLARQVISQMREVLAFMSLSSYTLDYFDVAREKLHIERGLQSIGETRFGTIYWSLDSVLEGMPAFINIVQDESLGIESEVGPHFQKFQDNESPHI